MEIKQCAFGHFYDASIHSRCPYCGDRDGSSPAPNILRREALSGEAPRLEEPEPPEELRPAVGWLACVAGPDLGRSYELHNGNNFIGRGDMMDINLLSDPGISPNRPVVLTYDSRDRAFFCGLTNGRELVRLNGAPLLATARLKPGDVIELSRTVLRFTPLCGPDFDWDWEKLD